MSIEAMKQALEALERGETKLRYEAITSLRQAIAEAEKQEQPLPPVEIGVDVTSEGAHVVAFYRKPDAVMEMFYSQFHAMPKTMNQTLACPPSLHDFKPPQRQWVGLTDEQISAIDWKQNETLHDFARAIEAKLKEKNGYAEEKNT